MLRRGVTGNMSAKVRESLYLDSAIISKCGLFYIAVTRGRIVTTVSELLDFNRVWATNIKNLMGYEEFYLAIKVEDELNRLCSEIGDGMYVLTNEGVAVMLSEVQRYQKSKMTVRQFMIILDRMIKDNVKKTKKKLIDERLINLRHQLSDAFGLQPLVSFNTNESGDMLSVKLLMTLSEIYNLETYHNSPTDSQIGELVRLISERENKFHALMKKTQSTDKFQSQKCLEIAGQIRKDKMEAYRAIYEHTIDSMDVARVNKIDE